MKNALKIFNLLLVIAVLSSCGTGRVIVLQSVHNVPSNPGIRIQAAKDTVKTSQEISNKFSKYLSEALYTEEKICWGDDILLKYRFLQINEGNRLARWFTAGIGNAGEGSLTIEATYYDKSDKLLGKIHTEGKIGSGFFGGSIDSALEKAASEIAAYTRQVMG
jgi:hypothetical protein